MGKIILALLFVEVILLNQHALADVPGSSAQKKIDFFYDQDLIRSHFSIGFESVSLSSARASIMGGGPKVGFEYGLTSRFSLGSNLVFAFQGTGQVGAYFYSGISGILRYTVTGSGIEVTDRIYQMGKSPIYAGKQVAQRRFCINLGLEQLFLNGSTSIYPAVGTTAGVTWGGILFGEEIEVDVRIARLIANDNPLSMVGFGANINLDFM
jgi:hypothetical protein